MSNVANQMTQVNQISEMIEPLIARAEAAEEAERESAEQALAKAYKAAQARMTTLGLTLPPVPEPGLQNYLTAQLAQLNTKQLVKSDLNTAELLERNELFQGLNLYMDGAMSHMVLSQRYCRAGTRSSTLAACRSKWKIEK